MPIDDLTALGQKMREARKNKELTELCTCCAVYSIVNVLMKEENLSFLLTLTKKAKNRRIK